MLGRVDLELTDPFPGDRRVRQYGCSSRFDAGKSEHRTIIYCFVDGTRYTGVWTQSPCWETMATV